MLKIGEFSRLSHLTVKALRFYEKEGLLTPVSTDAWSGYRFYETSQLGDAARIRSYRQMGLSIEEIRAIQSGADRKLVLAAKAESLKAERADIDIRLSMIHHILEDETMKYQVTEKQIPAAIVYYSETVLAEYADCMQWIPAQGEACRRLNPQLQCTEPPYEFCEYLDAEHRENNIRIRHSEAVTAFGTEDDNIHFRNLPETKVLSLFHQGPYDTLGEAYAFIMKYAEEHGYETADPARECYIDGIWNRESPSQWLTEIQLPVK